MINLLRVEQSLDQPSGDDPRILAHAIEKSEGIICVLCFFHRGCWKMGLYKEERERLE